MKSRLVGLDCLRGLAAIIVLLVHYSTRFKEIYPEVSTVAWSAPSIYGIYAVQLFFTISGFVIFMTLERVEKPVDFIKARFFRLYPPLWAAATFTFLLFILFNLPGREVSPLSYIVSLTMIPTVLSLKTLKFSYVDGVYWTLEREFFFYVIMAAILAFRAKDKVHLVIMGLLIWGFIFRHVPMFDKFWKLKIQIITLATYFKYFALGISLYCVMKNQNRRIYLAVIAYCLIRVLMLHGPTEALVFILTGALVYASTYVQRLPKLLSPLAFMGTISYCLYLVHQNLGYLILRELGSRHFDAEFSFVVAIVCSILAGTALCYGVEKPTMAWRKKQLQSRLANSTEQTAVS